MSGSSFRGKPCHGLWVSIQGWDGSLEGERDYMCKGGLQQERVRRPMEVSSLLSDLVDNIPREMKEVACHFYG